MKIKIFILFFLFFLYFSFAFAQEEVKELPSISISTIFKRLADILFYILLGLVIIFIIWGAITIVASSGDPNKVEWGKRIIIYSLVGLVLGIAAYGIVNLVYGYLALKQ